MKKILSLTTFVFISTFLFAQDTDVEMADQFRSSGKIYVVAAVMTILFTAFIIYLFTIDRRLKKLEK
jgi:hypothetical protein